MNFLNKLKPIRALQSAPSKPIYSPEELAYACESDRGRVLNSAALRRLQQKTQVFPLERNAAVRSRLTHSLEVMQVGRFIVQSIYRLMSESQQKDAGMFGLSSSIESLVEMSCLLHDVGNPPFGHFGEDAIQQWFRNYLARQSQHSLSHREATDIGSFEGNAQGIRIVHSLQGLNLSYPQIAGILKYTRCAGDLKGSADKSKGYLQKKPGYYLAEQPLIDNLSSALDIQAGCRHPLAYIMEAADDIAYCIADLEDAVEKGIMSIDSLSEKLRSVYQQTASKFGCGSATLNDIIDNALKKANELPSLRNSEYFVALRVRSQHLMVQHAAQRFIDNLESCYHGNLNQALIEDQSVAHAISSTYKQVAFVYAFSHSEVEESELQGAHILTSLLDKHECLLQLDSAEFADLIAGSAKGYNIEKRLLKRLAPKHVNTYREAVASNSELSEFYFRCRMIQDNISGMTDHFALDQYRALHALN